MKTVPLVYTFLMNTIYLSHNKQVAEGTYFRKIHGTLIPFIRPQHLITKTTSVLSQLEVLKGHIITDWSYR